MTLKSLALATAVLAAIPPLWGPVWAHDYRLGALEIDHPWARATPAGASVGIGYLVIRNEGETPDRLVGGDAPFAGRVEVHETTMQDDVMRMRPVVDGLEIPAGGSVTFEPGGYHVMFVQLQEPLVQGERRTVTLEFANAGTIEVEFVVEAMAAGGMNHDDHVTPTN
ncbi:MAG: copper chaperone PCu(A)C [Pseudomonadota bacterium]